MFSEQEKQEDYGGTLALRHSSACPPSPYPPVHVKTGTRRNRYTSKRVHVEIGTSRNRYTTKRVDVKTGTRQNRRRTSRAGKSSEPHRHPAQQSIPGGNREHDLAETPPSTGAPEVQQEGDGEDDDEDDGEEPSAKTTKYRRHSFQVGPDTLPYISSLFIEATPALPRESKQSHTRPCRTRSALGHEGSMLDQLRSMRNV